MSHTIPSMLPTLKLYKLQPLPDLAHPLNYEAGHWLELITIPYSDEISIEMHDQKGLAQTTDHRESQPLRYDERLFLKADLPPARKTNKNGGV
jgi:hypothetical protein